MTTPTPAPDAPQPPCPYCSNGNRFVQRTALSMMDMGEFTCLACVNVFDRAKPLPPPGASEALACPTGVQCPYCGISISSGRLHRTGCVYFSAQPSAAPSGVKRYSFSRNGVPAFFPRDDGEVVFFTDHAAAVAAKPDVQEMRRLRLELAHWQAIAEKMGRGLDTLRAELAMALDAAAKGGLARQQACGMEQEIAELRAALARREGWKTMDCAPKDRDILICMPGGQSDHYYPVCWEYESSRWECRYCEEMFLTEEQLAACHLAPMWMEIPVPPSSLCFSQPEATPVATGGEEGERLWHELTPEEQAEWEPPSDRTPQVGPECFGGSDFVDGPIPPSAPEFRHELELLVEAGEAVGGYDPEDPSEGHEGPQAEFLRALSRAVTALSAKAPEPDGTPDASGYHQRTEREIAIQAQMDGEQDVDAEPLDATESIAYLLELVDAGRNRVHLAEENLSSAIHRAKSAEAEVARMHDRENRIIKNDNSALAAAHATVDRLRGALERLADAGDVISGYDPDGPDRQEQEEFLRELTNARAALSATSPDGEVTDSQI